MTKAINPKLALAAQAESGRQVLTEQAQVAFDGSQEQQQMVAAIEMVGAIGAIEQLAYALSAQAIMAWEQFQTNEGYKMYGCKTWVEFLEKHPRLGLTKSKYYERKKLLESEGADAYDLLNSLKVPANIRRQLSAGDVQIEGNDLIVRDQRFPIDDAKKIKRALSQVIEQMERVENKSAKTEKELEKTKQKLAEAKEEARTSAMHLPDDGTDPVNQAYLHVLASLTELGRELAELPGKEADQRMAQFKPDIQHAIEILFAFSASNAPTRRPTQQPDGLGLTQAELADLMED